MLSFARDPTSVFSNCPLEKIYLGRQISYYPSYDSPFKEKTKLKDLTISNSVASITKEDFSGCSGLNSITIEIVNLAKWCTSPLILPSPLSSYAHLSLGGKAIKELVIPEGVNSIANNAFKNCKDLISLTVSPNVISISESAFSGCNNLNSIRFEDGIEVLTINTSSFSACPLTSIYLGRNLSYSNSPFSGRTKLTSVVIGDMVTSLGDYAFSGCSGLTSVTIPNSVTSIGESVFADCSDLTTIRFEDGENLLNIKKSSSSAQFSSCPLTTIYLGRNISYDVSPFKNLTQLTSLTIGNGVTSIGGDAFRDCSGLTSVTIPNSVTTIGGGAFFGCSGLTSVKISNSITSIGNYAFAGCSGLTSVTIPNSVTFIGDRAFSSCSGLTSVTIPNSVTTIGGGTFDGCI